METQASTHLVIGGGLIGMLTARELALAGAAVTLVEQGSTGRESSWAGGGILSPLHPWRYPEPVSALSAWSQARYRQLCANLAAKTGVDPEWTQSGLLVAGPEQESLAAEWSRRWGQPLEEVSPERVVALEPGLRVTGPALWLPEVAQVRNPRFVKAVRANLEQLSVRIVEGAAVTALMSHGDRVTGVRLNEGELRAETVTVAAGAWSAGLLPSGSVTLKVEPVRGQMLLFCAQPGVVERIVLDRARYVIPRRDGRVLVGSTLEHAGFEKRTTESAREELHASAIALVPRLADYPVEHHWAGLRPGSPNGVPYIGEHPELRGLFVNTGHFRNGVVMGLASARLAADLILGREPILDPAPFALGACRGEGGEGG